MHRLRPCDVRWRRFFLFVTVIVGKVTDGYVWMMGWMAWHGCTGKEG